LRPGQIERQVNSFLHQGLFRGAAALLCNYGAKASRLNTRN
jgi:hypothetical protein